MHSQLTLDQKRWPKFRFLLFIGFFILCVIIPAAKIFPFFERSERWYFVTADSFITKYSYFFDSYYIHESGKSGYYFTDFAFDSIIDYLVIPGWCMILLGILVLIFAIVEFLRKENFIILYWLSIITIISIFIEWLLIIIIMIQEPWKNHVSLMSGVTWYPPILNIYLLVMMLIGVFFLISANWLYKYYKPVESEIGA
ncbi:MAG: hypothetical protein ACFFB5_16895 [Promethearchaeota archaeon]